MTKVAGNLIVTRMEKSMKLYFRILRMKNARSLCKEVSAPFSEKVLKEVKQIAETQRKRIIPTVSKI